MTQEEIDWMDFLIYRFDVKEKPHLEDCEACDGIGRIDTPFSTCAKCLGTGQVWPGREVVLAAVSHLYVEASQSDDKQNPRVEVRIQEREAAQ